ncbi:MAG: class I SAM-dependent methyltransferase [Patescibacteria group bacterium]|nr:class I SAM-dependent methyltransferase [Patescibacteria group bacterium]
MPIGSFLSNFRKIKLSTADEKEYDMIISPIVKIGLMIVGIPHIGLRMRVRIISQIVKKMPKNASVLDAGCGYGILSFELAKYGLPIESIDFDPDRIKQVTDMTRDFPKLGRFIKPQIGSVLEMKYPDDRFNISICSEVIEHLKQDFQAVKELARVTKKNGLVIISVPTDSVRNAVEFRRLGHERPGYSRKMLENLATENNIKLIKYIPYEFTIGRIMARLNLSLKYPSLIALSFYLFYLISFLDFLIPIGEANASVAVFRKN